MTFTRKNMTTLLFVQFLLAIVLIPKLNLAVISINNNGYRGIEIVIHQDVPENVTLLETLKEIARISSHRLYDMTKNRAYFEEVTIILPSTWSSQSDYKTVPKDDYFSSATVRIAKPNPKYQHAPYTFQPGDCGEFGRYIHFTPEFLLSYPSDDLSNGQVASRNACHNCDGLSKVFLHEWLHLRYGVFDEYGITGNPQFPMFYRGGHEKIHGNTCPAKVEGWIRRKSKGFPVCYTDRKGNLIEDCTFFPQWDAGLNDTAVKASIMFMPHLQYADHICEDDDQNGIQHNVYAPNEHNFNCDLKSVRNVMESGPDFHHGRNPPLKAIDPMTKINVFQIQENIFPGFVLALDKSISMAENGKLETMTVAIERAIEHKLKPWCPVGMVSFATDSTILAQLTPVTDQGRQYLLSKIPTVAKGDTAIGKGLLAAVDVLSANRSPTVNGKIILITDGEENVRPSIATVTKQLQDANVIVYGMAFGREASKRIEDLCSKTGGKGWFYNEANLTHSLDSMLDEIFQSCGTLEDRPVINSNVAFKLLEGESRIGHFHVDDEVALEILSVFASYEYGDPVSSGRNGMPPVLSLVSPNGTAYSSHSTEFKSYTRLRTLTFTINHVEPGRWIYNVTNVDRGIVIANMMVTFERGNGTGDPVRVNSWISKMDVIYPDVPKIYAELTKGQLPVLNANVSANIFQPNGEIIKVTLKDTGKGADAIANDGVYTEYYTRYIGDGRYAAHIVFENDGSAKVSSFLGDVQQHGAPEFVRLPPDVVGKPQSEFSLMELEQVDEELEKSSLYNPLKTDARDNFNGLGENLKAFERFSTAGTIILSNYSSKDLIPPAKIRDLKVVDYSVRKRTVTLQWTSPGDDMNDGQAKAFDLRYHPDVVTLAWSFKTAFKNFTLLRGTLSPPGPYHVHSLHLQLPSKDDLGVELSFDNSSEAVYFAVKTVDEEGNLATLSNVAIVHFILPSEPRFRPPKSTSSYLLLGIGIGSGLIIFIILVVCIIFLIRARRKDELPAEIKDASGELSLVEIEPLNTNGIDAKEQLDEPTGNGVMMFGQPCETISTDCWNQNRKSLPNK